MQAPSLVIVPAVPDDLEEILRIEELSHPHPWTRDVFAAELKKSQPSLYTAREDGSSSLRGFLCFWTLKGEIQLLNLAVDPLFRRQGIGRSLLHFVITSAGERGIPKIYLEVKPSNRAALALYRSFGFKTIYTRPSYYPPENEEAWVMEWTA